MAGGGPPVRVREGKRRGTGTGWSSLDVPGLQTAHPAEFEATSNNAVGGVTVGLFAQRCADVALLGTQDGVKKLVF